MKIIDTTKYKIAKIKHKLGMFIYAMSLGAAMILAVIVTAFIAFLIGITLYVLIF